MNHHLKFFLSLFFMFLCSFQDTVWEYLIAQFLCWRFKYLLTVYLAEQVSRNYYIFFYLFCACAPSRYVDMKGEIFIFLLLFTPKVRITRRASTGTSTRKGRLKQAYPPTEQEWQSRINRRGEC